MGTIARERRLARSLLKAAVLFFLVTIGFAFTIFGEIAALLSVVSLVAGTTMLLRAKRADHVHAEVVLR